MIDEVVQGEKKLQLINPFNNSLLKKVEGGYMDTEGNFFPLQKGALRISGESNYTDNFGYQWNRFRKTQIDRNNRDVQQSRERFFAETNWDPGSLQDKIVLEAGSGAGRFTQVFLGHTGGILYSVDYSDAVSANYENNPHYGERLHLFQASIYEMPFPDNSFDKVFCFGVLQHTPDFRASIKALIDKAKPGAEIVVDFYPIRGWWTKLHAKYIFRPFTRKMKSDRLLRMIERNASWLIRANSFFDRLGLGRFFNRFLPVCDIRGTLPAGLTKTELREWVILDTFDMFSPRYDQPQRIARVKKWFRELGAEVSFAGFVRYGKEQFEAAVVRAVKMQQ